MLALLTWGHALQALGWTFAAFWLHGFVAMAVMRTRTLARQASDLPEPARWPALSVIIPARNEVAAIERALRSHLASDYPGLEVVAVDDRSNDGTGAVMDRVAAEDPRLTVLHLTELPDGWLGKCHALARGAATARGELLLFTDGDVVLAPDTQRLAVRYLEARTVDHLVLLPGVAGGGYLEGAMLATFAMMFGAATQMAYAHTRLPFAYVGVGAFNLARRTVYERGGGHVPLALEVADDLMLGKLLKRAGGRQHVLDGQTALHVRWQVGLGGIVRGLEKNGFAGMHYSLAILVACSLVMLLAVPGTYVLAFVPGGPPSRGFAAAALLMHACHALAGRTLGGGARVTLAWPLMLPLFLYTCWRSALITLWQGGVRWRDTFYPLARLRAGRYR